EERKEQPDVPGVTNFRHQPVGHWAVEALRDGKRFGFIASADHAGVARAGILVEKLSRTGLYEALKDKRCFGTTGLSMRLTFHCNDRFMGQSVECETANFRLKAVAAEPIKELQIVRNGELVEQVNGRAGELEYRWGVEKEETGEFWFCRLIFENGEMAWTSPIWLD
ncbi:MAG: hypothetical protein KGZ25_15530, partial [Planctomycetes bacterium]|nr:hypothetical protein [Planctomycetota bacterium]